MYMFLIGILMGIYWGTRYELSTYVDRVEITLFSFVKNLEKRKKTEEMKKQCEADEREPVPSLYQWAQSFIPGNIPPKTGGDSDG